MISSRSIIILFLSIGLLLQFIHACNLENLGKEFDVDKVNPQHAYYNVYCDLFESIKDKSIRMLEIGFGL